MSHHIGIVGLGVMGANVALNVAERGFRVAAYDIDRLKAASLAGAAGAGAISAAGSAAEMAGLLERPRRVLIMVPAGAAVDSAIDMVSPHLERGDILIDGGNSHFQDTERRSRDLEPRGLRYVGMGVSGGEEGARRGPSIMPGGNEEAWKELAPILRAIAARAPDGEPCVEYMGPRGAGHYVKMVHNGIEYADMQLIAETYDLLRRAAGMSAQDLADVFAEWNRGELESYLVEITASILGRIDARTGLPLVDVIADQAGQKGTGRWTSQNAMDIGSPVPTIDAAVESRMLSSLEAERRQAAALLAGPSPRYDGPRDKLVSAAGDALFAAKVTTYAQGFGLLRAASAEYDYRLDASSVAKTWRAGCIIRAGLLGDIMAAYRSNPELENLLLDETFREQTASRQDAWRFVVKTAVEAGIPVLALGASLGYYDAFRSRLLPANLIQAQRDYFGAHTYRRVDAPGAFHTEWGSAD